MIDSRVYPFTFFVVKCKIYFYAKILWIILREFWIKNSGNCSKELVLRHTKLVYSTKLKRKGCKDICESYRIHVRSKYKAFRIVSLSCGLTRGETVVAEKGLEREIEDGTGARMRIRDDPARNERKLAARNGTSKCRMTLSSSSERYIYPTGHRQFL